MRFRERERERDLWFLWYIIVYIYMCVCVCSRNIVVQSALCIADKWCSCRMLLRNTSPASKLWASCAKSISSQQMRKATRKLTWFYMSLWYSWLGQFENNQHFRPLVLSDSSVCYLPSLFCPLGLLQCAYCCFWHFTQRVPHRKRPALRLFQSWAGHDSSNWLGSIPLLQEVAKKRRHTNITLWLS